MTPEEVESEQIKTPKSFWQRQVQMASVQLSRWLALPAIIIAFSLLRSQAQAQSLYSEYPSRSTILAGADGPPLQGSNHSKANSGLDVLGYVTPWNPAGYQIAENYRGRINTVSPVWYTVKPDGDPSFRRYQVHGGPPTDEDALWYHRLQAPATDNTTRQSLAPVKIMPRFQLEEWTPEDYRTLLSHTVEGLGFTEAIIAEVMTREYDGVVLETGAAWALRAPVQALSDRLHEEGKELVIVLPPLRHDTAESNQLILSAVTELSPFVDAIHVMTYDHLGQGGALWHTESEIPEGSALQSEGVRTFGPNTPLEWIERNVEGMSGQLEVDSSMFGGISGVDQAFGFHASYADVQAGLSPSNVQSKLLVGVAAYGYTYPVGWLDPAAKPQIVLPPSSPIHTKDNSTDEQAKFRRKAEEKEAARSDVWPILAKGGDPFTFNDLREVLRGSKVLVRRDEDSGENYVDYLKAREDGATQKRPDGTEAPIAWYRRAYFPSPSTMNLRIETVQRAGARGIAIWDLGQGGSWLMHAV